MFLIFPYFLFLVQQIQSTYTILLGFEPNKEIELAYFTRGQCVCISFFPIFCFWFNKYNQLILHSTRFCANQTDRDIELCVEFTPKL